MTEPSRTALRELQKMDLGIQEARQRIRAFDPKFEEVEEPSLVLGSEAEKTRSRLREMKLEERRLELSLEEKKSRQERLEERLGSVRNLREEAAVSAELEMIKRALQGDEQEAYSLLDQIRKMEERLEELDEALGEASALVEPALEELVAERDKARADLERLETERDSFVKGMDPSEVKLYDGIRRGGRSIAVSILTEDGACGNCFGIVPLQRQNEVRGGDGLIRCEACGVILTAPDPEAVAAEAAAREAAEAVAREAEAAKAEAAAAAEAEAQGAEASGDGEADGGHDAAAQGEEAATEAAVEPAAEEPREPEAPLSARAAEQALLAGAAAEAEAAAGDAGVDVPTPAAGADASDDAADEDAGKE